MTLELVSGLACCGIRFRGSGPGWSHATMTSRPTRFLTATGTPASVAWRSASIARARIVVLPLRWRPRGLGSLSQLSERRFSCPCSGVSQRWAARDLWNSSQCTALPRKAAGAWISNADTFFRLFGVLVSYRTLVKAYGSGSLKPRLHKALEAAGATCAGTGRTRSASPGRPEATAGGATRGAS